MQPFNEIEVAQRSVDGVIATVKQLRLENRAVDAARLLMEGIQVNPASGQLFAELGMTLFSLDLTERAIVALERAVQLEPGVLNYRLNLSGFYHHIGRHRDCIEMALGVVRENPLLGFAHMNLGLSYAACRSWTDSLYHFEKATELLPDHCGAWLNLGLSYEHVCHDERANACFKRAVSLEPENEQAWICLATNHLRLGNFESGWKEFSRRFALDPSLALGGDTPIWQGQDLKGRIIHLLPEQGLGDLVQFIRFAQPLSELGATVIATVPEHLRGLLKNVPGISNCYSTSQPAPQADFQCTVMELPRWLKIDETNIPLSNGYLQASKDEPGLIDFCEGLGDALKVGIVWAGNPNHVNDSRRSMAFDDFACLLDIPNIRLVSLQIGQAAEQLHMHPRRAEVAEYLTPGVTPCETASLIANLDLVITVDTFVAHLAGALNVPTWVCLALSPDWRWLTGRADSPWYQSVRLFRQDEKAQWNTVTSDLVRAIEKLVSKTVTG